MNPAETLPEMLQRFPLQLAGSAKDTTGFRAAGDAQAARTLVLLHGIGSASASWVQQLAAAARTKGVRALAWDAPGYGQSAAVQARQAGAEADATDYALRLWSWLDSLGIAGPVTLVGHSLGAVVAARARRLRPEAVNALVLLSPARGYGATDSAEREQKLQDRLQALNTLGPAGMAERRGAAMLSPDASPALIAYVRSVMAQVNPAGYAQAAHLLSGANLLADLAGVAGPIQVASGSADSITPPAACREVARAACVPWADLGPVGHACPLEAAPAVNDLLELAA